MTIVFCQLFLMKLQNNFYLKVGTQYLIYNSSTTTTSENLSFTHVRKDDYLTCINKSGLGHANDITELRAKLVIWKCSFNKNSQ